MSKNRKIKEVSAAPGDRRREVFGVLGLGATLFLLVAMISLQRNINLANSVNYIYMPTYYIKRSLNLLFMLDLVTKFLVMF
jgi:hypothetical protein